MAGTTTTLPFHLVSARLTEAPVPTWHKRDPLIALCDEADFAVVAVGDWCGDSRDDDVCAGVSIVGGSIAVRVCVYVTAHSLR